MIMSLEHQLSVSLALSNVRTAAQRAEQAHDLETARQAIGSVRDAAIRAAIAINEAEAQTRRSALLRINA